MEQPIAVRQIGSLKQLNKQMKQACHGTKRSLRGRRYTNNNTL